MTIKIGDFTYRNVAKIEDMQTKKIAIVLTMNDGEIEEKFPISVTENNEVIFVMAENYTENTQDLRKNT